MLAYMWRYRFATVSGNDNGHVTSRKRHINARIAVNLLLQQMIQKNSFNQPKFVLTDLNALAVYHNIELKIYRRPKYIESFNIVRKKYS